MLNRITTHKQKEMKVRELWIRKPLKKLIYCIIYRNQFKLEDEERELWTGKP